MSAHNFVGREQTTARVHGWCDAECGGNLGNLNSKGPAPQISVPGLLFTQFRLGLRCGDRTGDGGH